MTSADAQVRLWEQHFTIREPVECIFEKGDLEQEKFTRLVIDDGDPEPIYKKDYAGLLAADHYAWEQAYLLKKQRTGEKMLARESFNFCSTSSLACIVRLPNRA